MRFTQANIEDYLRQQMARRLEEWLNVLTVRVQKWCKLAMINIIYLLSSPIVPT